MKEEELEATDFADSIKAWAIVGIGAVAIYAGVTKLAYVMANRRNEKQLARRLQDERLNWQTVYNQESP